MLVLSRFGCVVVVVVGVVVLVFGGGGSRELMINLMCVWEKE